MTAWSLEGLASRLDGFRLGPVDLRLRPGEVVAVLGRSGAGKTTLLRSIAGFLPVHAGRLLRDGVDLTDRPPEHRGLGYVPQGLGLLPHRTVERNVSYPLEVRGRLDALRAARELLERFGLAPLARRYPAQLSGGERERVALARALAAEPELVLWDEPWQALDVDARHALSGVLEEMTRRERLPVVVVTHDPPLAFAAADTFLVLRNGTTAFLGEPGRLLERPIDAFTARFAGFENVYDPGALVGGAPASLAAWLAPRAGPGGIAFARPALASGAGGPGTWTGLVRRSRPTPEGVAVHASVGELTVALRGPPPGAAAPPALGETVRFDVEEKSLRPLGRADGVAEEAER